MNQATSTQSEVEALSNEYRAFINKLKGTWLSNNRVDSRDVYEVMRPEEQAQVHQRIAQWGIPSQLVQVIMFLLSTVRDFQTIPVRKI